MGKHAGIETMRRFRDPFDLFSFCCGACWMISGLAKLDLLEGPTASCMLETHRRGFLARNLICPTAFICLTKVYFMPYCIPLV